MIENIIVIGDGEFDFQAHGYEPEIIEVYERAISYINPATGEINEEDCEFHGGAAIIVEK